MVRHGAEGREQGLPGKGREREAGDERRPRGPRRELFRAAAEDERGEIGDGERVDEGETDELHVRPEVSEIARRTGRDGAGDTVAPQAPRPHRDEADAARDAEGSRDRRERLREDPSGDRDGEGPDEVRRRRAGAREEAAPESLAQADVHDQDRNAAEGNRDPVPSEKPLEEGLHGSGTATVTCAHDPVGPRYRASPRVTRVFPASRRTS